MKKLLVYVPNQWLWDKTQYAPLVSHVQVVASHIGCYGQVKTMDWSSQTDQSFDCASK